MRTHAHVAISWSGERSLEQLADSSRCRKRVYRIAHRRAASRYGATRLQANGKVGP